MKEKAYTMWYQPLESSILIFSLFIAVTICFYDITIGDLHQQS